MHQSAAKDPWRLRKCKRCKCSYKPTCKDKRNAGNSIFCTPKCKAAYHRSGGMNIVQLRELLTRQVIKALKADDAFLEAIADKLRVKQSPSIEAQEIQKALRIHERLTGTGPIGREAAQALVDSFAPGSR